MITGSETIYLRANDDLLYALDKSTGNVKWGMHGFDLAQSIPGIEFQKTLYVYNAYPTNVLYAFDLAQIDKLTAEGRKWWEEPGERK